MSGEHRLSRILGYDGMRATMRGKPAAGSPASTGAPSTAPAGYDGKPLGYDGDSEGFVKKAVKRAKEFVTGKKAEEKKKPEKKEPPRPPTGQKKFLDRKLNPDTGEIEDKPAAAVKIGNDAPMMGAGMGGPKPRQRGRSAVPREPVQKPGPMSAPPSIAPMGGGPKPNITMSAAMPGKRTPGKMIGNDGDCGPKMKK